MFREFRTAFERLTGLPVDVLAPGEFRVPDGAPDFCHMLGLASGACSACHDAHARLQKEADGGRRSAECFAGLTSTAVPVRVKGKTLAYLQTGHVFLGRGGRRNWAKLRRFIERHGLDPSLCEQALLATRVADPAHYESAVQLLEIFARHLSDSLPPRAFSETYPAIEQALRLLRSDLEHDWTLAKIAAAVKMNPSYFSDVFRKSTGETFTACLSRLRVERACRMLKATRLGIGEIAFASGFRSVSQFNRAFKMTTGTSPGAFREMPVDRQPEVARP